LVYIGTILIGKRINPLVVGELKQASAKHNHSERLEKIYILAGCPRKSGAGPLGQKPYNYKNFLQRGCPSGAGYGKDVQVVDSY
jgi:hypothetical protein